MSTDDDIRALDGRIAEIASTPVLLVACDFDGTLAAIVPHPSDAVLDRDAAVALRSLAATPHTHVMLLSGRGLADLAERVGPLEGVHLVGSHGSESEAGSGGTLSEDLIELRDRVRCDVEDIARRDVGLMAERKPAGVALHFRNASDAAGERAVQAVREGPAAMPGVHVKDGKKVIELSVVHTNKGIALNILRQRLGASAAIFIGDDRTDEDAFATLRGPDIGVKVGDGDTVAGFRVGAPQDVSQLLVRLAVQRDEWIREAHAVPIERHTMLSDQRTVALLTPDARVVWCCLPRIDSPALFAELVGGPNAGHFTVRPVEAGDARQRYVGDTCIVETSWDGVTVTDFLDCSAGRAFLRAGRTDLIRRVERAGAGRGTGPVEVEIDFAPRLDFGRQPTRLRVVDDGLAIEGSLDPVVLRAPGVRWTIVDEGRHQRATARHALGDEPLVLELRYGLSSTGELVTSGAERGEQTRRFWEQWANTLRVPGLHADLVRRSALVLKGLCHGPSGAIAAAATTSLPEAIGGVRNWDYRFCWLRDAAMAATALARLGSPGVGTRYLDWILALIDRDSAPERFRPVYTVTGGHLHPEADIADLVGYRGSRPVRVSNAAAQQLQLDVFGPLLELVAVLAKEGLPLSGEHWRLTEAIVHAVELRWTEPDHGIWEIRGPLRHHVHSKVMCWVAVDRGISIAAAFTSSPPERWLSLREAIAKDIRANGWSEELGAFTAAYGERTSDAAVLHVGLSGLVPGDDPRFAATVERIERDLRVGPTVLRYRFEDGLPGSEGGFHLCTTWLIEAFALRGELDKARALLDGYVGLFGPTGLLSEEYDPSTGTALGNHPQAYTHLGLINAVLAVSER